jgi:thiol-disulfide isomerase/thioredoxin
MNRNVATAVALIIIFIAGVAGYLVTSGDRVIPEPAMTTLPEAVPMPAARDSSLPVEFSLHDIDGELRSLSEWNGKARLINFWATWCAPCRREIPLLKSTQATHASGNLQVIGIAVDFPEEVKAYAEEAQFNYPILVGQEDAMAAAEQSGVEFIGLPFTMIVAPGGELLNTHIGEILESHIETIVDVFEAIEDGSMDIAAARLALDEL